jgi:peptide/nickel transport system substrate-binding protein
MILSVLALSSMVAVPFAHGQTSSSVSTSIPSTPSLKSITLTDYGGDDQAGISDLTSGKIDAYDFAVTPTEATTIPSTGFAGYEAPAAWYGLEINPTNTTHFFNPFQFQAVRFALNYLVGRNYFVDSILGGDAIPTYSTFGGEPDQLVTSSATAQFSNITDSVQIANSSIYNTLIANGATFKSTSTPQWYYGGKPIIINIFDRSDDPVRHLYDGYLAQQLQSVGFGVNLIPGTLTTALTEVFGTDPANATWNIYPASYGDVYSYYDEGFAELYAPIAGALPASSSEGPAFGVYNDTAEEQPSTLALLNTADQYALDFFNTNFSSFQQRDADLDSLVVAGVKAAVVIGLATSLEPYETSTNLQGVSANFVDDPLMNALSFLTMNTASGTADIGVRHVAQSALNPVGGWNDEYSVAWSEATSFPPEFYQPSTGYLYPVGWSIDVVADNPTPTTQIPTSAVVMNATQDKFVNVASGTMAKTAVIANFAPMLTQSWADGQPLTLADILYQYILAGEVTQNTNSSVYDGYSSAVFGPSWSTVLGFQIVNSTSIEVYSTFYYPDQYYAGQNAAGALFAFTPDTGAQGMLPWQVYFGMTSLVSSGKDAWSSATATSKNLPQLSLVNPSDVSNIQAALTSDASASTIPPEFASLQSLTGVSLVTTQSADAGYNAAVNFIKQYGNGVIGNGPFILSQYSTSTSPAFAVLTKNPAFDWGNQMSPQLGAEPVLLSQQATIPAILQPGDTITATALQTTDGSKQAAPVAGANVTLQLITNGAIAYQNSQTSASGGGVTFTLPASLPLGAYIVTLWTSSAASTLYNPLTQAVELEAASAATSSSTTSTSTPTTTTSSAPSTTTSTSSATTTIALSPAVLSSVAVVTAVLIAAFALGTSRRRRFGPSIQPIA